MSKYSVERSIEIQIPLETVWEYIISFKKQALWSPWFIMEPTCKRNISGKDGEVGAIDSWQGEVIGSGERENTDIVYHHLLDQDIRFKKPFKSKARCYFSVQKLSDTSCSVTWGMEGSLPVFLFFMKKKIVTFVRRDYDRGLLMLKTLCETGKIETSTHDAGEAVHEEIYYISRNHACSSDQIGEMMKDDFEKLAEFAKQHNISPVSVRSYYPKVDFDADIFTFRSTIEISKEDYEKLSDLPKEMSKGYYPKAKIYSMEHRGAYEFLANTWTAAYMYLMSKKLKPNIKVSPYEIYINDPINTDPKDLKTQVCVPVK